MNTNIKYASIMLGALLTLVPYAADASLACSSPNCWQVGGDDTVTAAEISANVDVPNSLGINPVGNTTYYWIGGYTTSPLGTILTQPGLEAIQGINPWRGVFQSAIGSGNTQEDFQFSNLYWSRPASINVFDELFPSGSPFSGKNFQQLSDNNNVMNIDSATFSKTTYGHTMSEIDGALESYDFTGSDFHNISSTPIHFTTFDYAATYGGSFVAVPLTAYSATGSGSPPSCITSTASSGSTTVSASSC